MGKIYNIRFIIICIHYYNIQLIDCIYACLNYFICFLIETFFQTALSVRNCFIAINNFEIELFPYDNPKKLADDMLVPNENIRTVGTKHLALETDDMDALKNDSSPTV